MVCVILRIQNKRIHKINKMPVVHLSLENPVAIHVFCTPVECVLTKKPVPIRVPALSQSTPL